MQATLSLAAARRGPSPGILIAAALGVLVSAGSINLLARLGGHITGIWISNAVLLCFLLKQPSRDWPKILLAGLAGNATADFLLHDNPFAIACMVVANAIEVLLVAIPMRRLRLDRSINRPRSLLSFYALAVVPAPLLSALFSSLIFRFVYGADFVNSVLNWYAADALGLIIIVPPVMTVRWQAFKAMFEPDQFGGTILAIASVIAVIGVNYIYRDAPIAFLFFPAIALLTFQRGFAGGAVGLVLSAGYLLLPVLFGDPHGMLRSHTLREQILLVQIYVAVMGFSMAMLGAALEERKRLERGLAAAIRRAETSREEALVARDSSDRANRAKSMFLANMSHELRTPLNAVIGFSEIMQAETFGPLGNVRYREYTRLIQDAGRHLLDLINDVLDMSKIEAGKHELVRERLLVGEIIGECVDLMRERAQQADVDLQYSVPPGPLWVDADRRAIKQILLNLLSNAIKFTPARGHVVAKAAVSDDKLILLVTDTGIGIPADQLYRLGNPFVQLNTDAGTTHSGTGLGLALVRALAQMHQGTLKIESIEGKGTTVSVTIPLAAKANMAA